MMHTQVFIASLLLFLTDAVVSEPPVRGTVGQDVIIPCTYTGAITSMCWGRGTCPSSWCSEELISTDGTQVTYQMDTRYKLKGSLMERDVSLTIENSVEADSGLYCCRVEHRGWFNDQKLTFSLEIKAVQRTRAPTSTRASTSFPTPTSKQNHKPVSPTQPATNTQPQTAQETKAQPPSSPRPCCPTDWNGTVTESSDGLWQNNQTEVTLEQSTRGPGTKGLYAGVGISVAVLLSLLAIMIIKRYLLMRNKLKQLRVVSFNGPQVSALQGASEERMRAEDNVYIVEENLYVVD